MLVNSGKHFFCDFRSILLSDHAVLVIETEIRAGIVRLVKEPIILVFIEVDKADILLVILVIGEIHAGITAALHTLFRPVFTVHKRSFEADQISISPIFSRQSNNVFASSSLNSLNL